METYIYKLFCVKNDCIAKISCFLMAYLIFTTNFDKVLPCKLRIPDLVKFNMISNDIS